MYAQAISGSEREPRGYQSRFEQPPRPAREKESRIIATRVAVFVSYRSREGIKPSSLGAVLGAISGAQVTRAMGKDTTEKVEGGGLDAATLESLRLEIRAGFREAFSPLRQLAGDMEKTMRQVSAAMARIDERRGTRR